MSTSLFSRIFDDVSSLASRVTATVDELCQFATEVSIQEQPSNEEVAGKDDEIDKSELEVCLWLIDPQLSADSFLGRDSDLRPTLDETKEPSRRLSRGIATRRG